MALLPETVAISILIRSLLYLASRLKADPATKDLAPQVMGWIAQLQKALAAHNAAENAEMDTQAFRDFAADSFTDALVPFGQRLAACHGGSRTATGYTRVFEVAPSKLAETPQKDQVAEFARFLEAIKDAETPKDLAQYVTQIESLHGAFKLAHDADAAQQKTVAKAVTEIGKARTICLDGIAQIQAELNKRFPRNRKKVARYFLRSTARSGAKLAVAPVAEPAPVVKAEAKPAVSKPAVDKEEVTPE